MGEDSTSVKAGVLTAYEKLGLLKGGEDAISCCGSQQPQGRSNLRKSGSGMPDTVHTDNHIFYESRATGNRKIQILVDKQEVWR